MNIKRLVTVVFILFVLISSAVYAENEGVFLCMRGGNNVALYSDGKSELKYIDMISSNGADATPIVSASGNTYLPFRFICEMAGLKDSMGTSSDIPNGSFRFSDKDGKQIIEINYNGNYIVHQVGVEFSYELNSEDVRTVSIYNIDGTLYFPMTYLAKITGATALWNSKTKDIMYIDNNINKCDFIDDELCIHNDLLIQNGFFTDYNNSLYSDAENNLVTSLRDKTNEKVISATKTNGTIFYVTETGDIKYTNDSSNENGMFNFKADTVIAVKNRLYGIDRDTKKGFICKLDGSDFAYITDMPIFNLILREYNHEFYLYYCESENSSKIHMIPIKTMDTYDIEITDYEHNNLILDVQKFVVDTNVFTYIDKNSYLHTITLDDPLEEFEIALVSDDNIVIEYINYDENGVKNK